MSSVCLLCQTAFVISDEEKALLQKIQWTFGDTVVHPAEPVYCPECRLRIRTCHRNERFLYRATSALSCKPVVSIIHEDPLWGAPYVIYSEAEWKSDQWDPFSYGFPDDPSRSFFDQWKDLHKAVPRMAVINVSNEDSEFVTGTAYSKNCYLTNSTENSEDCYYGKLLQRCKNAVDCAYLYDSELCYECFSSSKCYDCAYLSYSQNCQSCFLSSQLNGCKNCFLCVNLSHKEYCYRNEQLSKEEYEKRIAGWKSSSAIKKYKHELNALCEKAIHRYAQIIQCENCTGDCLERCQNCLDCYDVTDSQDSRFVHVGVQIRDVVDCSNVYVKMELCYEVMGSIETSNSAYCIFVFNSQNLLYCEYCFSCSDCFGCNALTHKKYCIFNKQYSKEEYERIVPQIIDRMRNDDGAAMNRTSGASSGSWGKFIPPNLSPFGYNESLAHEYLPLSREEALQRGFLWYDAPEKQAQASKTIPAQQLPDTIDAVPDDVLEWAIQSETSGRPFRIIKPELQFYRQMGLPLPRRHPDERYEELKALRNPRKLWSRPCSQCQKIVQSTYAPERPETVLCEECYRAAVY